MKKIILIPLLLLTACTRVGSDPWAHVDYTEEACGTKEAVLTTTGCVVKAPAVAVASAQTPKQKIDDPNDVNNSHNATGPDANPAYQTPDVTRSVSNDYQTHADNTRSATSGYNTGTGFK